ncbi:hypothetical protein J2738_002867 [Variovorax paradoxus]|uniref:Uncharacterized protein n=1 Tax=Variovorax paradoxus TaxID=34073 RepID=A0AAE3XXM6_VARPD|nr:hypothetical protein [Variovorax paradoxus]
MPAATDNPAYSRPVFKACMRKHPETQDLLSATGRQVLEA